MLAQHDSLGVPRRTPVQLLGMTKLTGSIHLKHILNPLNICFKTDQGGMQTMNVR